MSSPTSPFVPVADTPTPPMLNDSVEGESPMVTDLSYTFLVHRSAIVIDSLSILCSILIILTLVLFPKLRRRRMWIMIIGISVGDIIFSFHHGLDHIFAISNIYNWPRDGPLCNWFAIGTTAGFWYQSAWILCMAVSFLYEFMQDLLAKPKVIPMRYLFITTTVLGTLPWIIGISLGHFGRAATHHPTWCHFRFNHHLSGLLLFDIWMIIFNVLLIICYCLLGIRFRQLRSAKNNDAVRKNTSKAIQRILLFPLIYSFQWLIYCLYLFFLFATGTAPFGLVEAVVLTANGGGIWNGIVYYGLMILKSRWKEAKSTYQLPSLPLKTKTKTNTSTTNSGGDNPTAREGGKGAQDLNNSPSIVVD